MLRYNVEEIFKTVGLERPKGSFKVYTPIDGTVIGNVHHATVDDTILALRHSETAFEKWRKVPAPKRGELIRLFADILRKYKPQLGELVTLETGKIYQEGLGEVQEMIDICDFAVGLSRQQYGLTMPSERSGHRLMETWHPLGVVGVITAFNFPVAVWAWNFALAIICGDSVVWKPSEKAPLTAIVCQKLFKMAIKKFDGEMPDHLLQVILGGKEIGEELSTNPIIKLVSATGSTEMGRAVATNVAQRLGRSLLELGGNNGMIVTPSADLEMAEKAIVFSAVGTAGQRCTTLRRLFVHEDVYNKLVNRLKMTYKTINIGNPLNYDVLVGPIIDEQAYKKMQESIDMAQSGGATITGGERILEETYPNAYYVQPAIVEVYGQIPIVQQETFAPILYVMKYNDFDDVLKIHNNVPQGLSSSIFSNDIRETEKFLVESDCGLANVNIGPSGAEIGGAFGGEKDTGGGREAGSDAWKNYMRRATNTINYSKDMPLAQGLEFDVQPDSALPKEEILLENKKEVVNSPSWWI